MEIKLYSDVANNGIALGITGPNGGQPNKLDSLPTLGVGTAIVHFVDEGTGQFQTWRLRFGNDTPAVGIVRPQDYNATANPKVWERVG